MEILNISVMFWTVFLGINSLLLVSSYCLSSVLTRHTFFSATLAATLLIYFSQITVTVLLLGVVFQFLTVWPLGILNLCISVGIIWGYWRKRKPFVATFYTALMTLFSEGKGWSYLLFLLLLLQVLISLFKVAILPVHIVDSLAYRAPPAVMWYQLGYIPSVLDVPVNEINGRSLGLAVLILWYFIFLQDSLWVNLPQFISALSLFFIVYAIARQCGVTRHWSFCAAVLCFFMPSVLIQSTATQDHLSINVAFLCALFFLREFFRRYEHGMILLLGICVGLMFDFKNNAVVYMPVLLGAGFFLYWQKHKEKATAQCRNLGRYSMLALLLAFCIGGYWTARNLIVFGDFFGLTFAPMNKINHIYDEVVVTTENMDASIDVKKVGVREAPVDNEGNTVVLQEGQSELPNVFSSFLKTNNLVTNIKEFFPRILDNQRPNYAGHMLQVSGFGPQFFTFGLPALIWLLVSLFRKKLRIEGSFYAVSAVSLLLIYFCVMSNVYAYRNFVFFAVLLLIFFFCIICRVSEQERMFPVHHVLHIWIVGSVVWTMYVVSPPVFINANTFKEFVSLDRTHQTVGRYAQIFEAFPKIMRQLNELPEDEPLAYINPGVRNTWIYANYDVHWKRRIDYIPMIEGLLDCNGFTCKSSRRLKEILYRKKIHLVNMCVSDRCPDIKDPQFFEIGGGLYYFEENVVETSS